MLSYTISPKTTLFITFFSGVFLYLLAVKLSKEEHNKDEHNKSGQVLKKENGKKKRRREKKKKTKPIEKVGYLHIFYGPMFSAKTTNLKRSITHYADILKNTNLILINHTWDTRDEKNIISSHASDYKGISEKIDTIKIDLLKKVDVSSYDIIGIDEAQFFTDLNETVRYWLSLGKFIYIAGLIADAKMNKFGQLGDLIYIADKAELLQACCVDCIQEMKNTNYIHNTAAFTYKLEDNEKIVDIGDYDKYIPVCRKHYIMKDMEKREIKEERDEETESKE